MDLGGGAFLIMSEVALYPAVQNGPRAASVDADFLCDRPDFGAQGVRAKGYGVRQPRISGVT